jgi:NAD-dependent SIR2 family protein deacetylase
LSPKPRQLQNDAVSAANTAIFLGAGASNADGAPLQGGLFQEYFGSRPTSREKRPMDAALAAFFKEMFSVDIRDATKRVLCFPTFEEVLGLTDLALMRKEAFRGFPVDSSNARALRSMARHLIFLVAEILNERLTRRAHYHPQLVRSLQASGRLRNTMFISTNYDILIDNALTALPRDYDLDYGVQFRNFRQPDNWTPPRPGQSVQLYKPHGSLNWLYCPTCNDLVLTPKEKGVTRLIAEDKDANCPICTGLYSPVLVPPSFYKDLNNVVPLTKRLPQREPEWLEKLASF